jgi:rod shape-determining protein MreC
MMRASLPFRQMAQRSTFILLLLLSVAIMLIGRADPTLYERTRMAVTDVATPILETLSRPVAAAGEFVEDIKQFTVVFQENEALREENLRLRRWRAVAQELETENVRLRGVLHFVPEAPASFITGRVIGDSGGAFLRSILVNVGERDGVRKGTAAVDGNGLLGRVAEVGGRSARILLVTDLNSRIPVLIGEGRDRAIMVGDNTDRPEIKYLSLESTVSAGDLVVTSGHGGAFPAGLPVGMVVITERGDKLVQPFLRPERLEFIRMMDFGLTGVLQDREVSESDNRTGR